VYINEGVVTGYSGGGGHGEGFKVKAPKTSGESRTPVRHTIPLWIVIFLVVFIICYSAKQILAGRRPIRGILLVGKSRLYNTTYTLNS